MNAFRIKEKLPVYIPSLAVGTLTVQNIIIPNSEIAPKVKLTPNSGLIYSQNGTLVYKGPDGSITFIASS